ncbi:hypothetical protein STEG23_010592 [Scotinomys teguina]
MRRCLLWTPPPTWQEGIKASQMDETEIRSFFARYGSVKEVKIITDRTGVSKGYGFVSFYNDVDVQKIVESQISFHGKKLKLGPAIRKQNLCAYHVQPRPLIFNPPPPPPQFQSVWSSPNAETYMQPPTMMNPITQYVQAYPPYPSSPVQVITGYQLPVYNYQMPPQWPAGEQRSYVIPPAYTAVGYHCSEADSGAEALPNECSVHEATPASGSGPQKKSVDRSIQTVVSCLFSPENRLRNSLVTQDDYFKETRKVQVECLSIRARLKREHLLQYNDRKCTSHIEDPALIHWTYARSTDIYPSFRPTPKNSLLRAVAAFGPFIFWYYIFKLDRDRKERLIQEGKLNQSLKMSY